MSKHLSHKLTGLYLISVGLILSLTLPVTLTWDGYLYLTSGLSLFSKSFPTWYFIMKEPGFPLLIYIAHALGNTMLWLTIFQSILISLAIWGLCEVFRRQFRLSLRSTLILGTSSIYLFIGFAAAVMQQSLILFVLSMAMTLLNLKPKFAKISWLSLGALSILTGIAISLIVTLSLILVLIYDRNKIRTFQYIVYFTAGIALVALPWFSYTANLDLSKQRYPTCRTSFCLNGFDPKSSESDKIKQMIMAVPSLVYLNKENYWGVGANSSLAEEATTYGIPTFSGADNCLRLGPGPTKVEPRIEKVKVHYCVSPTILKIRSEISKLLFFLFPLSGLIFIYWIIEAMFFQSFIPRNILVIPFSLVIGYAASGAGISRYDVLVQTIGPFLLYAVYLKNRWNRISERA